MDQVDPKPTQGLHLLGIRGVHQPDMQVNFTWRLIGLGLKTNPQPSLAIRRVLVTAGRYRVGKHKKAGVISALCPQPLDQESIFVVQHFLQSFA